MQTDRLNWNDLRYFLELSRKGRLLSAAQRLGVNHTTVSRRIAALEEALGVKLFEQDDTGFHLTSAGDELQPLAQQVEDTALLARERIRPVECSFSGRFRIGMPDDFGNVFLAGRLQPLLEEHPDLVIEMAPMPLTHDILKREVDLAVGLEPTSRADLACVKISDYLLQLFVSKTYVRQHDIDTGDLKDIIRHPFADYLSEVLYSDELSFNKHIHPEVRSNFQSSTVRAQYEFVAGGGGFGVLPYYMAGGDKRLMPVLPRSIGFVRSYWLIIPLELRRLGRIRQLETFILQSAANYQQHFMPKKRLTAV